MKRTVGILGLLALVGCGEQPATMNGGSDDGDVVEVRQAELTGPTADDIPIRIVDSHGVLWGASGSVYLPVIGAARLDNAGNFWVYAYKQGDTEHRHLYAMNFATLAHYDANGAPFDTANLHVYSAVPNVDSAGLHYCSSPDCHTSGGFGNFVEGTYAVYGDGNGGARAGVDIIDTSAIPWTLVSKTANTQLGLGCGNPIPCGGPGNVNDLMWIQGSFSYAN